MSIFELGVEIEKEQLWRAMPRPFSNIGWIISTLRSIPVRLVIERIDLDRARSS